MSGIIRPHAPSLHGTKIKLNVLQFGFNQSSIPSQPWSHIALGFVCSLPVSSRKSTILTVVDRFSKSEHFIALKRLPTASQTANILVDHVFSLYDILTEIVSDRGPQFTSQVSKTFCSALGAKPSLALVNTTVMVQVSRLDFSMVSLCVLLWAEPWWVHLLLAPVGDPG